MMNEHTLPPLSGGKPRHAVIFVHGLGDSGAGLIGLGEVWRRALPDTEFLAPDAPFPCDMAPFGSPPLS
jgi:phospholipase/carboxylesterase